MSSSLPNDFPADYTYIAVSEGQFRVKEIRTEESALVSYIFAITFLIVILCCGEIRSILTAGCGQYASDFPMHLLAHFILSSAYRFCRAIAAIPNGKG